MNSKIVIKIVLLSLCFFAVLAAMNFSTSSNFTTSIDEFFGTGVKYMKWCPDHTYDFKWLDPALPEKVTQKWLKAKPDQIKKTFCQIAMETATEAEIAKVQFKPLLKAESAEAKTAILEWDPESKLFQVQGMPFKSSSLSRELLDEPQ